MKNLTNKLNEKSLLILLKQGDYEAFSSIYHMDSMRILGRFIRLVKSEQIAEEISQELFLRIWENKECINPGLSFKSFLFTISQNLVYDHFRKTNVNQKILPTDNRVVFYIPQAEIDRNNNLSQNP